jgi:hypothetical protein
MRYITSSPILPSLRSWIRVARCAEQGAGGDGNEAIGPEDISVVGSEPCPRRGVGGRLIHRGA